MTTVTYKEDEFASSVAWLRRNSGRYDDKELEVAFIPAINAINVMYNKGGGNACYLYSGVHGQLQDIDALVETCAEMLSVALGRHIGVRKWRRPW